MKGLLFGVFDLLHEGHKYFISRAEAMCDDLAVAVTPDAVAEEMKGKAPRQNLVERMRALSEWNRALDVRAGDERNGSWKVLRDVRPDVIFVGYDQEGLKAELASFGTRIEVIGPHEPERYKSSLMGS